MNPILLPIILPLVAALVVLLLWRQAYALRAALTVLATAAVLVITAFFMGTDGTLAQAWGGFGLSFSLRLYHFSRFMLIAAAGFSTAVALYSWKFMEKREHSTQFQAYLLITLAMTAGAVLANNLILLLFFWEGLLLTLFGMIAIGSPNAYKTATKAFIIVGVTDLCLMLGIVLTAQAAGTFDMSGIHQLPLAGINILAMLLLVVGAVSKAGSMPFHSWIPDAAVDAPLPFMAFLPASLEKLLGIYLLARISLDMFMLKPESWVSIVLMSLGAVTILLAVMMALVQKDFKRLLSYHAISQVGYMILGIGTALPIGIIGGLFHMINHALYKSCLFLTGGSVERQAGTTALEKLGGLGRKMPVTFICFIIAAAAISGVPPLNGFFSKEMVYDAALERNVIFYLAAILGTFLTAASFLKLGHSAFLGKRRPEMDGVKEAPLSMLVPMIVIASTCVLFGLWNALPLNHIIGPILASPLEHKALSTFLIVLTSAALIGAFLNHILGTRMGGGAIHAVDHIYHSRVLEPIYLRQEKGQFDPYVIGLWLAGMIAKAGSWVDRAIDWLTEEFTVGWTRLGSFCVQTAHTGSYALYVIWVLVGAAAVILYLTV